MNHQSFVFKITENLFCLKIGIIMNLSNNAAFFNQIGILKGT